MKHAHWLQLSVYLWFACWCRVHIVMLYEAASSNVHGLSIRDGLGEVLFYSLQSLEKQTQSRYVNLDYTFSYVFLCPFSNSR